MAGTVYVCMHTTPSGSTYRLETNDYSYGSIIKSCQEDAVAGSVIRYVATLFTYSHCDVLSVSRHCNFISLCLDYHRNVCAVNQQG